MIDLASLPSVATASLLVGVVLVEAVVLYLGYGAVERILAPSLKATIENV